MPEKYFNTKQLVERYNLKSSASIRQWIEAGKFPPFKTIGANGTYLWLASDIEDWERTHGGDTRNFRLMAGCQKQIFCEIYPSNRPDQQEINGGDSNSDDQIKSIADVMKESGLADLDGDNSTLDFTQDLAEPLDESEADDDEAVNTFAFESRIKLIEQKVDALIKSIMTLSQYTRSGAMMRLSEAKNVKLPIIQFVLQEDESGQCEGTDD